MITAVQMSKSQSLFIEKNLSKICQKHIKLVTGIIVRLRTDCQNIYSVTHEVCYAHLET